MSSESTATRPPAVAFYLLASITVAFMAAASAPMPLYPYYQSEWGFSPLTITVIFGVYALAVLAALLVFGRLSDHVGRKPVLFASIAAVGAGLLDLDKGRGALANAITTPVGTATGGIVAGLFVRLLPAPTELIYFVLGAVVVAQGIALLWMDETTKVRPGALASLRPQFSFSSGIRAALLSGLAMFAVAGSGGIAIVLLQEQTPREAMKIGAVALSIGVLVIVTSLSLHTTLLFFAGLMVTGVGFGTGFQGALRSIVSQAHADERAGVLSVIFVIAYLSMGLPAMGAGYLLSRHNDLSSVTAEFSAAIAVLALLPLIPLPRWPIAARGNT
ncbi:MAG: MFS transporter [Pseudomonadota bacterium]